jgi:glycosyltransferase involved in cell wall biosynthesis
MSKNLFITPGDPLKWASSRLRATWVAQHLEDTKVVNGANCPVPIDQLLEANNYIWVKLGDPEIMTRQREKGSRVFWDLCDPVWWFSPKEVTEIIPCVDKIIFSNDSLELDFLAWVEDYGVLDKVDTGVIPDRIDFDHYPIQKLHRSSPDGVQIIWFGAAQNRIALFGAFAILDRLAANGYKFSLTVYDDMPSSQWDFEDNYPVYYSEWQLDKENQVIASHDIALLPDYPGAWGEVKSNNKLLTALACGLPVMDGLDWIDAYNLVGSWQERQAQAEYGRKSILPFYDVKKSAEEWREIFDAFSYLT